MHAITLVLLLRKVLPIVKQPVERSHWLTLSTVFPVRLSAFTIKN